MPVNPRMPSFGGLLSDRGYPSMISIRSPIEFIILQLLHMRIAGSLIVLSETRDFKRIECA